MEDFILRKKDGLQYLIIPSFSKKGIVHGFSTRKLENSKTPLHSRGSEYGQDCSEFRAYDNREKFLNCLNLEGPFWSLEQVHGSRVLYVGKNTKSDSSKEKLFKGDGLVTAQRGVILTMYSADCVIIFLFDPVQQVIGLGHAGWRGTIKGIGPELVKHMAAFCGCRPEDILVGISPAIGACCYEVGEEVIKKVSGVVEDFYLFTQPSGQAKWMLDLKMLNSRMLETAGIKEDNITVSSLCTYCHPNLFFSYRRNGGIAGRMMSVISLP